MFRKTCPELYPTGLGCTRANRHAQMAKNGVSPDKRPIFADLPGIGPLSGPPTATLTGRFYGSPNGFVSLVLFGRLNLYLTHTPNVLY